MSTSVFPAISCPRRSIQEGRARRGALALTLHPIREVRHTADLRLLMAGFLPREWQAIFHSNSRTGTYCCLLDWPRFLSSLVTMATSN